MILSDFSSIQKHDDSNPYEIISISFNMQNILQTRYYNIGEREQGKYLVHRRSQAKTSGMILPKVHSIVRSKYKTEKKQVIMQIITPEA